jgi:hypothetical protein
LGFLINDRIKQDQLVQEEHPKLIKNYTLHNHVNFGGVLKSLSSAKCSTVILNEPSGLSYLVLTSITPHPIRISFEP